MIHHRLPVGVWENRVVDGGNVHGAGGGLYRRWVSVLLPSIVKDPGDPGPPTGLTLYLTLSRIIATRMPANSRGSRRRRISVHIWRIFAEGLNRPRRASAREEHGASFCPSSPTAVCWFASSPRAKMFQIVGTRGDR